MSGELRHILGLVAAALVVLALLGGLAAFFRLEFGGRRAQRLERRMLRTPDTAGLASLCGFAVPADLPDLYRSASFIEDLEFELVDESVLPARVWEVDGFIALVLPVAKEWRFVSGVPGIPIALDLSKGVYYVNDTGEVCLRAPGLAQDRVVAPSVKALAAFKPRKPIVDDDAA